MKCKTCHGLIRPDCEYNQGRCPHRKPMIEIQPRDPSKGHFYVSLVKSLIRILAGISLVYGSVFTAGVLLIVAEMLGVVEELV